MKPVTEKQVLDALKGRRLAAMSTEPDGVHVTTWTVAEMDLVKVTLRKAGIVWDPGLMMNNIRCTGIKEVPYLMAIDPGSAKAEFEALPVAFQHHAMHAYRVWGEQQRREAPLMEYYRRHTSAKVVDIHSIGDFQIIELRRERDDAENYFEVWSRGERTGIAAPTLDLALMTAICGKYSSESASYWVARMIGMVPNTKQA